MDIQPELATLLVIIVVGTSVFAPFEVETPAFRKIIKWTLVTAVTLGLTRVIGHWAALLPVILGAIGVVFHTVWCRRHGIDPLHATPRKQYYKLRGWPCEDHDHE